MDGAERRNQRPERSRHDVGDWRAILPLPNIKPYSVNNYTVRLSLYIVLFALLSAISERMTPKNGYLTLKVWVETFLSSDTKVLYNQAIISPVKPGRFKGPHLDKKMTFPSSSTMIM